MVYCITADYETPDEAKVKRPSNKLRVRQEDSDYVKLAKKGGHSGKTTVNN